MWVTRQQSDTQCDLSLFCTASGPSCFSWPCGVFSTSLGQAASSSPLFALLLSSFFFFFGFWVLVFFSLLLIGSNLLSNISILFHSGALQAGCRSPLASHSLWFCPLSGQISCSQFLAVLVGFKLPFSGPWV